MTKKVNAFYIVHTFERAMREYTGAPYAVAVDTCTAALFLCFSYYRQKIYEEKRAKRPLSREFPLPAISVPCKTFVSVPMMAIQAGFRIKWRDTASWPDMGNYQLYPFPLFDAAIGLRRGIFEDLANSESWPHPVQDLGQEAAYTTACVSFQHRKQLPIGRGGMILTESSELASWCRSARFFGRHEVPSEEETGPELIGWHAYMEPERAARGLALLMHLPDKPPVPKVTYPDLSKYSVFDEYVEEKKDNV